MGMCSWTMVLTGLERIGERADVSFRIEWGISSWILNTR